MTWGSLDSAAVRVFARFSLIAVCTCVAILVHADGRQALLLSGSLTVVALLASISLPAPVPPWLLPIMECCAAVAVLSAIQPVGTLYLPYLVAPVTAAGLLGGLWPSLVAAALASVAFVTTSYGFGSETPSSGPDPSALAWVPVLASLAVLAAAVRRLRTQHRQSTLGDPAYADAQRLLTELHGISRHLSLGLEPRTLSEALLEEVREIVPVIRATVVVRTEAGALVTLAGHALDDETAVVVDDAWWSNAPLRHRRPTELVVAIPIVSAGRVLAAVCLVTETDGHSDRELTTTQMADLRLAVARAAPRLASALLFDQVRRLATVDERNRVAREIHDGIAQDLASLGYLVDDIASEATPPTSDRLTDLGDRVRTLVQELRLRIFDLRADVDDALGLGAAVTEYVQRVGADAGLTVQVTLDEGGRRLPTSVEIELLRIVQEAVTNVRRHARASTLAVNVIVEPPAARLTISDDGRGLQSPGPDSMGIRGMRERAARIGAVLSIGPRDGGGPGTTVEVVLEPTSWGRPAAAPLTGEDDVRERVAP
jgi:signal transduction histidine kinase